MIEKTQNDLTLMSLFDGVGGFPIAWAKANNIKFENLEYYSSEIEEFLINILNSNLPKSIQLGDITKIDIEKLKKLNPSVVTMGTPCTGFSVSGNLEGLENEDSKLFTDGVEIIDLIRPKYFVWENVFGVFSSNDKKEYREILNEFKRIGYDTAWTILDTQFFGLPQKRRRVYMIGVKNGIKKENNIFELMARQSKILLSEEKNAEKFFEFDFNKESKSPQDHFAFFNRQRSDKFKEIGISNTLTKRDYKDVTNVVIKNGLLRKVTPKERLRLQGIPDYWFDCTYAKTKSEIDRFRANGMSINVVEYVFEQLLKIEDGSAYNMLEGKKYEKEVESSNTAYEVFKDKAGNLKKITSSGFMYLDRNENGDVKSDLAEYHFVNKCTESSSKIELSSIENILLDEVEDKFVVRKGGAEGMLKRELKSDKPLPVKMKEVIFHQYPELILEYK